MLLSQRVYQKYYWTSLQNHYWEHSVAVSTNASKPPQHKNIFLKTKRLWGYGSVLVYMAWITCSFVKATLMLNHINRFWNNLCCYSEIVPCAFLSKKMSNHILLVSQQHGSIVRAPVLCRLACSLDLSPTANIRYIMKQKSSKKKKQITFRTSSWSLEFPNACRVVLKE